MVYGNFKLGIWIPISKKSKFN